MDQCIGKWDKEAEDEPDVDHLGVRRWGQLLYLTCKDSCVHQHDCQVYCYGRFKIFGLEEVSGIGDDQQEHGGHIGGQQLGLDLPLQGDHHVHLVLPLLETEVCDGEHDKVFVSRPQLMEFFWLAISAHHQYLSIVVLHLAHLSGSPKNTL